LYRTRLTKTRSEAQAIINKGRLRLTRGIDTQRVRKAHFQVRAGDQIAFTRNKLLVVVEMVDVGTRRGPATEAQSLYIDLSEGDGSQ
jgi:ribosome-associated heat shock protein Hsp15